MRTFSRAREEAKGKDEEWVGGGGEIGAANIDENGGLIEWLAHVQPTGLIQPGGLSQAIYMSQRVKGDYD